MQPLRAFFLPSSVEVVRLVQRIVRVVAGSPLESPEHIQSWLVFNLVLCLPDALNLRKRISNLLMHSPVCRR